MNPPITVELPAGVVMTTSFAPAPPAGVTQVTVEAFTTLTLVAATPPMVTPVAPVRFDPDRVIVVPPARGPEAGETVARIGGWAGGVVGRVSAATMGASTPKTVGRSLAVTAASVGCRPSGVSV